MQWIVGLDAMRAFAMIIIVAYHFLRSSGLLTSGFIFIELFFVISGYLMATRLLYSYRKTGEISILPFIRKRAARLWPPVALSMLVALALAFFTPHELLVGLRQDTLAGAAFTTNLVEIISGKGYENTVSPNLFEHLWFVALEFQLCVLLPIILSLAIMSAGKYKTALRRSLIVMLVLAFGSMALMGLYGGFWQKIDRAYFALDTQAFAFFLGAALAIWRILHPLKARRRRFAAGFWVFVGLAALAVMSGIFRYGDGDSFYWGMPLAAILSVIALDALLVIQRRRTVLLKPLRVLEFLGKYSFAVYLMHYPLMLLVSRIFKLPLMLRFVIVLALSLVLAVLLDELIAALKRRRVTAFVLLLALIVPAALVLKAAPKESPILQENSKAQSESVNVSIRYVQGLDNAALSRILEEATERSEERIEPSEEGVASNVNAARVLVIGDSVTLGAKANMESVIPGVYVDAEESRGVEKAVPILNQVAASGNMPKIVVVSLATNERCFTDDLMQGIVDAARGSRVIFVTAYAGPDQPRESQNEAIRNFANNHENVYYADWWELAHDNWSLMYTDHIHLDIEGREVYTQLLYNTIMNTGGLE